MVAAERSDLADLGETLEPVHWDAPSLCEGWKVRHVFAHVVQGASQRVLALIPYLFKARLDVNKALLRAAIERGDATEPNELVEQLRASATARTRPPGTTPAGMLAEALVHGQDIRRALRIVRDVPGDRASLALWSMVRTGSILGNKKRITGVRLVATDVDWSHGGGPEVRGPAEALLMATCGRHVALEDLDGPGVDVLRCRRRSQ